MWSAGDRNNPEVLQINSIENYIRYDVVTLLESVGRDPKGGPLKAVILSRAEEHLTKVRRVVVSGVQKLANGSPIRPA